MSALPPKADILCAWPMVQLDRSQLPVLTQTTEGLSRNAYMQSPATHLYDSSQRAAHIAAPKRRTVSIWPEAVIALGLSLSATWTILLGYGLVKLIRLAI
jgi:hypothetical protein